MPTATITLPSGLSGEIRNMKAKELSILAAPNGKAKKGKQRAHPLDPVFEGCWLKTIDPGPYKFAIGEAVPWPKVMLGDRFVALLHIRHLTYGEFDFKVRCRNGMCIHAKKPFNWKIDLTELDVKPFPATTIERIKAGNTRFDIEIAGKKCTYELLTGAREANHPLLDLDVDPKKKLLASVASRLVTIDGAAVDPEDDDVLEWVGEIDIPELVRINKEMEKPDGGAETRTTVECPSEACGMEFVVDVPFGEEGFLSPRLT